MDLQANERLAFSLSGAGDSDQAHWHLLIVRYKGGQAVESVVEDDSRVEMDSGGHDEHEWIRELLIHAIEAL